MQYKWVQHKSKCVGGWWDHSSTAVSLFNSQRVWSLWSCQIILLSGQGEKINSWNSYRRNSINQDCCWNFMLLLYTIYNIHLTLKLDGYLGIGCSSSRGGMDCGHWIWELALISWLSPERKETKLLLWMLSSGTSSLSDIHTE